MYKAQHCTAILLYSVQGRIFVPFHRLCLAPGRVTRQGGELVSIPLLCPDADAAAPGIQGARCREYPASSSPHLTKASSRGFILPYEAQQTSLGLPRDRRDPPHHSYSCCAGGITLASGTSSCGCDGCTGSCCCRGNSQLRSHCSAAVEGELPAASAERPCLAK